MLFIGCIGSGIDSLSIEILDDLNFVLLGFSSSSSMSERLVWSARPFILVIRNFTSARIGNAAGLTADPAIITLFFTTVVLAVVSEAEEEEEEEHVNEVSEGCQTLGVLNEAGVEDTKEENGNKEDHGSDVNKGESAPDTVFLPELLGCVDGKSAHEWDRVEDYDTIMLKNKWARAT